MGRRDLGKVLLFQLPWLNPLDVSTKEMKRTPGWSTRKGSFLCSGCWDEKRTGDVHIVIKNEKVRRRSLMRFAWIFLHCSCCRCKCLRVRLWGALMVTADTGWKKTLCIKPPVFKWGVLILRMPGPPWSIWRLVAWSFSFVFVASFCQENKWKPCYYFPPCAASLDAWGTCQGFIPASRLQSPD